MSKDIDVFIANNGGGSSNIDNRVLLENVNKFLLLMSLKWPVIMCWVRLKPLLLSVLYDMLDPQTKCVEIEEEKQRGSWVKPMANAEKGH